MVDFWETVGVHKDGSYRVKIEKGGVRDFRYTVSVNYEPLYIEFCESINDGMRKGISKMSEIKKSRS